MNVIARQRFISRAEPYFSKADFLYNAMAQRLQQRFEGLRIDPVRVLELGARGDGVRNFLTRLYPEAQYDQVAAPLSEAAFQTLVPDQYDIIISNLSFTAWADAYDALLRVRFALKSKGVFFFSLLGPDSLQELRQAFSFDRYPHVMDFHDMHNVGDLLLQCGFENPVMEGEYMTVQYRRLERLFQDLRHMGWQYAGDNRRRGLMPKRVWNTALERYLKVDSPAHYPMTLEMILGHAWVGEPVGRQEGSETEVLVPLDRLHK